MTRYQAACDARPQRCAPPVACTGRLGASCSRQRGRAAKIAKCGPAQANVTNEVARTSPFQEELPMSFRTLCTAASCAALMAFAPAALAQDWPNRSILAISTVSAGNAADTVARVVLDQVGRQIGQSFVIENRTGAGGTIGSASAAKADADGYTLLLLTA